MAIKNRPFFIPKKFKYQPDFYTEFFGNVNAVFTHPTKNVTIYLEISADRKDSGDMIILYQAEDFRWCFDYYKYRSLMYALKTLETIMSNEDFGITLKRKPVLAKTDQMVKFVKPEKTTKISRHKANGTRYVLTTEDKAIIRSFGCYSEDSFNQIEEAINRSTFTLDGKEIINAYDAICILGKEEFLSGIARSAFHWTSSRNTADNKHTVGFNSSIIF